MTQKLKKTKQVLKNIKRNYKMNLNFKKIKILIKKNNLVFIEKNRQKVNN